MEEQLRSQNKAKQKRERKKVAKSKKFDEESDSDEEYVVKEKTKVPTKKITSNGAKASRKVPNPKPKVESQTEKRVIAEKLIDNGKKKTTVYNLSDSDDDDDIGTGISLMDRLHRKTSGLSTSDVQKEKLNEKKRPSPRGCTASATKDFESFEIEDFEPGKY